MSQLQTEGVYKLTCPSSFSSNIDSQLPLLLKSIDGELNSGYLSQVVNFLFGQEDSVLCHISRCELEDRLLKPTLFSFSHIFSSSLAKTLNILENSEDSEEEVCLSLSEILQICLDVLDGYNDILTHLINISLLKPNEVESLIKTLPPLLLEAFNYCNGSENAFGSYFTLSTELLTAIFRKSYELNSLFYKLLDEHIDFDCTSEKDVALLVNVLETLCSIGEIVVSLDAKSLAEQWKNVYKLMTKYSNNLKDRLNISQPLKYLTFHLKKTISSICGYEQEECNEQVRNRNLKLGSFILKIIVKLCELYCGHLDSCVKDLLELLLLLNRCSRLCRKSYNDELERFIVVGAGPLLSHLVLDRQFVYVFKIYCDNIDGQTVEVVIGLFFTILRLLKFLVNCNNPEVKEDWIRIPLVQSLIVSYSKCCKHLDLTTAIDDSDTYTTLISLSVAYATSNLTTESFILLEQFLISNLFKSDIEVGVLCSDFITLLCRLTNDEVCLQLTRYMFHALNLANSQIARPEVSLVRVTGGRLYSLLSKTGKEAIEKEFPLSSHAWRHSHLQSNDKLIQIYPSFESPNNDKPIGFMKKIESLHLMCSDMNGIHDKGGLICSVRRLLVGHRNCCKGSDIQADWFYESLNLLLKCVVYISPWLDTALFDEILDVFLDMTFSGQLPIYYYISGALAKILKPGSLSFNPSLYLNKISNIFQLCLTCDNVAVKQQVAEHLVSIHYYKNGNVPIEIDHESQEFIAAIAQKTLPSDCKNIIFSASVNFVHKCNKHDYEMEESPPSKKMKQDIRSSANVIIKLKECVEDVINYAKYNSLSHDEKKTVHSIICSLETL